MTLEYNFHEAVGHPDSQAGNHPAVKLLLGTIQLLAPSVVSITRKLGLINGGLFNPAGVFPSLGQRAGCSPATHFAMCSLFVIDIVVLAGSPSMYESI